MTLPIFKLEIQNKNAFIEKKNNYNNKKNNHI